MNTTISGALAGDDQIQDEQHEVVPAAAQSFVAVAVIFIVLALMMLAPIATRVAPMQKGWWVEPKTWPLVCLTLTLAAAVVQASQWYLQLRQTKQNESELAAKDHFDASVWAFQGLQPAFEYTLYFCAYLFLLGYIGFAISTLVFMSFVVWRSGLRGWQWQLKALLFTLGTIVAFRILMQLWFPMPDVFLHLPDWFVQNIAIYL